MVTQSTLQLTPGQFTDSCTSFVDLDVYHQRSLSSFQNSVCSSLDRNFHCNTRETSKVIWKGRRIFRRGRTRPARRSSLASLSCILCVHTGNSRHASLRDLQLHSMRSSFGFVVAKSCAVACPAIASFAKAAFLESFYPKSILPSTLQPVWPTGCEYFPFALLPALHFPLREKFRSICAIMLCLLNGKLAVQLAP